MAHDEQVLGSGDTAPQNATGANPNGDSASADQGADKGGAQVSAEEYAKLNKRLDDMRSAADRDRDIAKAQAEQNKQLIELLGKQGTQASTGQDQAAIDKAQRELEERIESGDMTGRDWTNLLNAIAQDARDSALAENADKMTAADKERAELKAALEAMRSDLDPAYIAQKEKVDEVVEKYGVTRSQAIKIVSDAGPSQPARPDTSGSLGTSVVSSGDDNMGDAKINAIVAGLAQAVGGRKPTEAEMAKLQKKWSK